MANTLASNMEETSLQVSAQTAVQYFHTVLDVRCHFRKDLDLGTFFSLNICCKLKVTSPAETYQRHLWLDKQYFLGMDDRTGNKRTGHNAVGLSARRLVRRLAG